MDAFDGLLKQVHGVLSQLDRLVGITVADQARKQLQRAVHVVMGVLGSSRINTAADFLPVHRPWRVALAEDWSDEDDDQQPVPSDKDKVNSRLADIGA